MKTLLNTALLIAVLFAAGAFLLPTDYAVERSITINAPAEVIHEYVNDLERWEEWTPWSDDPSITITRGQVTSGVGATQMWDGEGGTGRLVVTGSSPNEGIVYDVYIKDEQYKSEAAIRYSGAAGGTRVDWSMQGDIDMPVVGGYMAKMMGWMIGTMFDTGLARLKDKAETAAR